MALARLDIPGLALYGGSIAPGHLGDRDLTIQDVFEAVGAYGSGKMNADQFKAVENTACPGAGACGGQFTANTMSTVMEFLGISPMGSNGIPATVAEKEEAAFNAGRLIIDILRSDLRPSQIITRKAIENAIAAVAATGGSTNAVLHLLAIAREAGVELTIDDFDAISSRTPLIADLKPGGRLVANDLYKAGGIQLVAKRLLDGGLIHGDALTVSGNTLADAAQSTKETAVIGDPNLSCSFGVQILAGRIGRDGAFPMTMRVNTYQDPDQSSAGHRLAVGFQDPNQVPGDVMLVQARVLALCPRTAAQLRRISVSLTTHDSLNGATTVMQGVQQ